MATADHTTELPSYNNPPLDEVACGCQFRTLDRVRLPHYGTFWDSLRKDFPTIVHVPPMFNGEGMPPLDSATSLPLPRVWFLNEDESRLLQFQQDRLYFNWRKRNGAEYPRFEEIYRSFIENYTRLSTFASDMQLGPIQPTEFELSYINHLVKGEGWDKLEDFSKIFKDFRLLPDDNRFLGIPSGISLNATYPLPNEQGTLNVKVTQGKRSIDSVDIYSFDLSVRGITLDLSESGIRAWFDLAHEWIVRGFTDLTTSEIQYSTWGRKK